ncbi:MAG: prolipoprotein diacylglyceryl transferase [Lachnospiraceae bacterium]|nr:prolipoprotein diacylglyceryl transferase [Lachnospiraceae bacterium]
MTLETGTIYFFEQRKAEIPEAVSLFGFPVSLYGVCLLLAAAAGVFASLREGRRRKQDKELTLTLLCLAILSALIGARVYYAVFQWYPFSKFPLSVLNFRIGGFAYFGALIGSWFIVRHYCHRKAEDFERAADVLCVGASVSAVFVWIGCALAREPVGRFYDGIFSVRIGTEYLPYEADGALTEELLNHVYRINDGEYISIHPVALYGVLSGILILIAIRIAKHFIKQNGKLFLLYLFLNAVSCLVLEVFRASRCRIWGTEIPINSLVAAVVIFVLAAGELRHRLKRKVK